MIPKIENVMIFYFYFANCKLKLYSNIKYNVQLHHITEKDGKRNQQITEQGSEVNSSRLHSMINIFPSRAAKTAMPPYLTKHDK